MGGVKNSIGNGESKKLICIYAWHRHEFRGDCQRKGEYQVDGGREEKNWDNCNSIIDKIYFLKNQSERERKLSINTMAEIMKVLSAEQSETS